jgi:hypothetical protein
MFKSVFVLMFVALALQAQAQSIRLGQPSYGGTGCPAGSASVTVSPDQSAITVLFDQFIAEAGQANRKRFDRRSCNLTIPVDVPNGYSVSIFQVDYRGFNLIPRGGMNRFDAEYFWAGSRGPILSRVFYGPLNDNFTLTDALLARTLIWTPCGQSVNLRINASMTVNSNSRLDQTVGMVDSADISSGLIYHIQYRRCH